MYGTSVCMMVDSSFAVGGKPKIATVSDFPCYVEKSLLGSSSLGDC